MPDLCWFIAVGGIFCFVVAFVFRLLAMQRRNQKHLEEERCLNTAAIVARAQEREAPDEAFLEQITKDVQPNFTAINREIEILETFSVCLTILGTTFIAVFAVLAFWLNYIPHT